jgi:hypothetical protein
MYPVPDTPHRFTASPVPLELSSTQRMLINDNTPGGPHWTVGATLVAAGATTNVALTATRLKPRGCTVGARSHLPAES